MTGEILEELHEGEELRAAARSRMYALFCEALRYPDDEMRAWVREGELSRALRATLASVEPGLLDGTDWDALAQAEAGDEEDGLAIEHTRLFEVGASGPPCALYGGLYNDARMKTMEEVVRFYNHFGLTMSDDPRELPDHLATELEFLHFLAFREAEALHDGGDPGPYRRAARDFVQRHPGRWVPKLLPKLRRAKPPRFYDELFALLARVLDYDRRALLEIAGPAPSEA